MSRQIQIRRGTAAEHETFTGADGEVTVDTTNYTLRVHDGTTPGGHTIGGGTSLPENIDYVTEWQTPTAENNYTWYRKYASGWVEQGGRATTVAGRGLQVLLPVPMEPNQFFITNSSRQPIDNWAATPCVSKSADGTYIQIAIVPNSGTGQWVSGTIDWAVKGIAAQ